MDGSDLVEIVPGLNHPVGIVVDYDSRRLFWTEFAKHTIHSSNFHGTDVRLVVQLKDKAGPHGIAIHKKRLFWGNHLSHSLQSSDKAGQHVRTLYNGKKAVYQLIVRIQNPVQTWVNHCEWQDCSGGICVLNRNSYRCVA